MARGGVAETGAAGTLRLRSMAGVGGLAFTLAVIALAYAQILGHWFLSDDFWYLRASQVAGGDFVLNSFDYTAEGPVLEFVYRPLYPVAFLLEYKLFGLTAWQYHLASIGLHMVNTTLVWLLARKLTKRESVAFVAAFVFGLHPSYAPAVAWITSNVAVFAMVFSLSAVLLFLHYLDGGARRWLFYGASLLAIVVAMLIHPESLGSLAIMGLALVALQARSLDDLRSPRFYLPVLPHIVLACAFLGIHQYVRAHNAYQQDAFGFGWHMAGTYGGFLAYLTSPVDPTADVFLRWRGVVSLLAVGGLITGLLATRSFDVRVRALVIVWVLLAVLPLSTFTYGVQSRKLYVAGAPFALMAGMAAVSLWDWLAPRLRPFDVKALDIRYAALAGLAITFAVGLPLRTWQVTDRPHMARASLLYIDDQTYRAMVDTIREEHPTVPDGVRIDLAHVPWTLLILRTLDPRIVDAVRLYYGDVAVVGVGRPDQLPPPPPAGSRTVIYTCPPVCGPPPPAQLLQDIQEGN